MPEPTTTAPAAPAATTTTTPAAAPAAGQTPNAAKSFTELKERARAAAKPATPAASDTPAKPDPDIAAVERILHEDRRVKDARAKLDAERAQWAAEKETEKIEVESARAAKLAREKGDVLGLLKALGLSERDIYEGEDSLIFKLADLRGKQPQLAESERIEQVVQEKLTQKAAEEKAAAEKAAADAAEVAKQKQQEAETFANTARDAFSKSVATIAAENTAKYPTLIALEIPVKVVTDYAWNTLVNSKGETVLTEQQALEHLEEHYRAKVEKARGGAAAAPAAAAAAKDAGRPGVRVSAATPNPSWQAQAGTPAKSPASSLGDKFRAVKERARAAAK